MAENPKCHEIQLTLNNHFKRRNWYRHYLLLQVHSIHQGPTLEHASCKSQVKKHNQKWNYNISQTVSKLSHFTNCFKIITL